MAIVAWIARGSVVGGGRCREKSMIDEQGKLNFKDAEMMIVK